MFVSRYGHILLVSAFSVALSTGAVVAQTLTADAPVATALCGATRQAH